MAIEVVVDRARCVGTRACINAAPRTFALDDAEVAVVVDVGGDGEEAVIDAARSCPTGAISVIKDGDASTALP